MCWSRSPPTTASSAGANAPAPPTLPASKARSRPWRRWSSAAALGQGGHAPRSRHLCRLGVPADDRQLRLRRHRHGAVGPVRQGMRPAALPHASAAPCARRSTISTTWNGARRRRSRARPRTACKRGYRAYYIKAGVDERKEEAMLEALRDGIGPEGLIRIDVNQAWTMPQAVRLLKRWHEKFTIDFVEAPVRIDPIENKLDLMQQVDVPICVNEGLWREADAYRIIKSRCGDYLCFSQYWVGSLGALAHAEPRRPSWRAGRSASTPTASSASPPPPASTSCWPPPMPPRPPADRPDDGGRYPHRAHPHRRRPALGPDRRARPRRRGRRGQGRRNTTRTTASMASSRPTPISW